MNRINRQDYLKWLQTWRGRQIIKVVSGVRRCGKSTLFDIYRDYLLEDGVLEDQIIAVNFEDLEFEDLKDYKKLYAYIKERVLPDRMNYIFLDEIQHADHFEKVVDSFFLKENCDVYITGSNAYFMSGELATLLSGRYVELKMLPLSFSEYSSALKEKHAALTNREKFERYMRQGSFPYLLRFNLEEKESREYLQGLYSTILLNDIVARFKIADVNSFENVIKFLLHNIGSKVSPTKISNTLISSGMKIDQRTISKYLRGLTESLLMYEAPRYNIKGKQLLSTQSKYYAVDTCFRNILVKGSDSDIGHILENIVFLELKRRGFEVYVGHLDSGEVDFVAVNGNETAYFQVSATVLDEDTLVRELRPLRNLRDNYPKFLLTLDEVFKEADYEGIKKLNVIDWLLQR